MKRVRVFGPLVLLVSLVILALGACNTSTSNPAVPMIPDPTDSTTSVFAGGTSTSASFLDDAFVEVSFELGFTFPFFGTNYSSIWINTNGGVTFGAGTTAYYMAANTISSPGIGILWSDLDPSQGAPTNGDQIDYQQFDDHFVITYTEVPQYTSTPPPANYNSMTLTLYSDGKITMTYDTQDTTRMMVGVFDGSKAGYVTQPLQTSYNNYSANTGTIVFDSDGGGASPTSGQLNGMTLTFNP